MNRLKDLNPADQRVEAQLALLDAGRDPDDPLEIALWLEEALQGATEPSGAPQAPTPPKTASRRPRSPLAPPAVVPEGFGLLRRYKSVTGASNAEMSVLLGDMPPATLQAILSGRLDELRHLHPRDVDTLLIALDTQAEARRELAKQIRKVTT